MSSSYDDPKIIEIDITDTDWHTLTEFGDSEGVLIPGFVKKVQVENVIGTTNWRHSGSTQYQPYAVNEIFELSQVTENRLVNLKNLKFQAASGHKLYVGILQ